MFKANDITFSPRKIYWFAPPVFINNKIKIELLKHDILLIECEGSINSIKKAIKEKSKHTVYIFNLDQILEKNKTSNNEALIKEIVNIIKAEIKEISFVYTKNHEDETNSYCLEEKINHETGNVFTNKKNIIQDISSYIFPIFKKRREGTRKFLRLIFFPFKLYEIDFPQVKAKTTSPIKGYLKDLSLNGIAVILFNADEVKEFNIGEKIDLKLILGKKEIIIKKATTVRTLREEKMVCITFNINEKKSVTKKDSNELTNLIYKHLEYFI